MRVLALDLGTSTGWAHSSGKSGVWDISIKRDESAGIRLLRLRNCLNEIARTLGIDIVVFEAARNLRYGNATRVLAQLQAVVELWCADNNVEYKGYSPCAIKRFALSNGRGDKDAMLKAARARWSGVLDHNHADALWLLELAHSDLGLCHA